jgi:hypothetical protein
MSEIDQTVEDCNLCGGLLTADTDTNMNSIRIAKISEREHIFFHLHGISSNNKRKVVLELMMHKNTTITAMPKVITPAAKYNSHRSFTQTSQTLR